MLLMTSPGTSPNAAAGMPITGAGSGPSAGGTAGLRMSPVVAGTTPHLGDAGLRVKDGLLATAGATVSSSVGSATSAVRRARARRLPRSVECVGVVMVRFPLAFHDARTRTALSTCCEQGQHRMSTHAHECHAGVDCVRGYERTVPRKTDAPRGPRPSFPPAKARIIAPTTTEVSIAVGPVFVVRCSLPVVRCQREDGVGNGQRTTDNGQRKRPRQHAASAAPMFTASWT